uniref:Uncharacterized protein n=1 Tax=Anguilla anguilla TaxID=7936 RepID=A0A0E9SJ32_ANGAN
MGWKHSRIRSQLLLFTWGGNIAELGVSSYCSHWVKTHPENSVKPLNSPRGE